MLNFFKRFKRKKEKHKGESPRSVSNIDIVQIFFIFYCMKMHILSIHREQCSAIMEDELLVSSRMTKTLRFVCISDTHSKYPNRKHTIPNDDEHQCMIEPNNAIPDGDVLIHAGDFTLHGLQGEVKAFNDFIGSLPHKYKIVIAGNHEHCLNSLKPSAAIDTSETRKLLSNCIYLQDEVKIIDGIRIFGSPWTIEYGRDAFACNSKTLKNKWDAIPTDIDVLITHTPPYGYGTFQTDNTLFINASICTKGYHPINKPIVFELEITPGYGNKDEVSLKFNKSGNQQVTKYENVDD